VRSPDYTNQSNRVKVTAISGSTITVESSLGYVPSTNDIAEFCGYNTDNGDSYIIL